MACAGWIAHAPAPRHSGERGDIGESPLLIASRRKSESRKGLYGSSPDFAQPWRTDLLRLFKCGEIRGQPFVDNLLNRHSSFLDSCLELEPGVARLFQLQRESL